MNGFGQTMLRTAIAYLKERRAEILAAIRERENGGSANDEDPEKTRQAHPGEMAK